MKSKKIVRVVTAIVCLLPLIAGVFGFGGAVQAAAEGKVDVTLHKKKMDQFPTNPVENTGKEMAEFEQYEGLAEVTFEAWDITTDFYTQLNKLVAPNASKDVYEAAVKDLMKNFKLNKDAAVSKGSETTDKLGLATFADLDKRTTEGTYKVYLFEETDSKGATASAVPLILVLPVVDEAGENTDIHLYPKNKIKGEIDKELVDEDGKELTGKDRYDYEVGKKIYYHASFTIPSQIGEILDSEGSLQTRYTKLQFKDEVSQNGVKFEGIERISIADKTDDIKAAFLSHGTASYTSTAAPYNEKAGFTIDMNLSDAKSDGDAAKFASSKETAEYLKPFGGKTLHIYYAISFTDKTPVDVDINNNFSVELTHDGQTETDDHTTVPPVVTGGKKFMKHESEKENQGLDGAKFVVIKKEDGKDYYLTNKNDQMIWTEVGETEDFATATHYTSENGGHLQVSGLAFGTYYLREIEAPKGFQLLETDKEFIVDKGSFDDAATLPIANVSKGGFLPSTGGTGIIAFLVIGAALMTGAFIKYRQINHA
ncbi:SpaH/EbpB family LPXTG-anchored major pilin [Enterococcus gilvus]|uniref:SpaH/EbpB family LPXTG-anchored major pilin n=1 Tax=Enterococcus gilvus TaxID=160453 RepID=UPI00290F3FF3|nr:SpaH/EbpB family LPXTG-anchored major pilin [Enterococcus gilvus]MDU5510850.1 SpaH/EbpB family LPXTG-anchored major pilin [Enterococcus gilvus]